MNDMKHETCLIINLQRGACEGHEDNLRGICKNHREAIDIARQVNRGYCSEEAAGDNPNSIELSSQFVLVLMMMKPFAVALNGDKKSGKKACSRVNK